MGKSPTIDSYFIRKSKEKSSTIEQPNDVVDQGVDSQMRKSQNIASIEDFDINLLQRDPGLRPQISDYPVDKRDEVRRAYIKCGPYQCILPSYPRSGSENHQRCFQPSWFKLFPSWLEYSPTKDAAFYLPCYLFPTSLTSKAYIIDGFRSWKKVRDGKNCAFLAHIGKELDSSHRKAEKACNDLMNQSLHIQQRFERFTSQEVAENRLRLKASIDVARWLAFQGCAFRGHDETKNSLRPENFQELLNLIASYNSEVTIAIDKAPKKASYTSPQIQKEILHVFATKVKNVIREEIGDAKFCIIVDEARDESKKEQMYVVLRFVDKHGLVKERFSGLVHVKDTAALTLKNELFLLLSQFNLRVHNIRGQGYDGASNMRGMWNGLQALISIECPYAYYVHCMAHRLQLALVAASKEVIPIHHFFTKLNSIVNIVGASCKRNDQLKAAHAENIAHLLAIEKLESGRGLNQIGSLQRPGDTRRSSHFRSICSLINMYSATCEILLNIIDDGATGAQRGDADAAYEALTSFEFVFILHLMKKLLEISNLLCQALQLQSQDILNAMHLVSSTKTLIQNFKDGGWDDLIENVRSFCEFVNIPIPNLDDNYVARRGRVRHQVESISLLHHFKFDIFHEVVNAQLSELNCKFNEDTVELLVLSSSLDPREMKKEFRVDDVCKLVEKYYSGDFADHEMMQLRMQVEHFGHVRQLSDFGSLSTISDLCEWMVKTRKSGIFPLVYRVVTLILTLPVSTATTERSFSAMKIIKNKLRNKIEDQFLSDCLLLYIEKEIAENVSTDSLVDEFRDLKKRRILF